MSCHAYVRLQGFPTRRLAFDGTEESLSASIASAFGISLAKLRDDAILVCDRKRPHQYRDEGLFLDSRDEQEPVQDLISSFEHGDNVAASSSSGSTRPAYSLPLCDEEENFDQQRTRTKSSVRRTRSGRTTRSTSASADPCHSSSASASNDPTMSAKLSALRNLDVEVLWRLRGGKGGFGALLKKLTGGGKKTTNTDAMRDLSGRRLRHAKTVERFQQWMQKKKDEDELVAMLMDGELPEPTIAKKKEIALGDEFLEKLQQSGKSKLDMLQEAKKQGPQPFLSSSSSSNKRPREEEAGGGGEVDDARRAKGLALLARKRGEDVEELFAEFMGDASSDASVSSDSDEALNIRDKKKGGAKRQKPNTSAQVDIANTTGNKNKGDKTKDLLVSGDSTATLVIPPSGGAQLPGAPLIQFDDGSTSGPPAADDGWAARMNAAKIKNRDNSNKAPFAFNEELVVDLAKFSSEAELQNKCTDDQLKHTSAKLGLKVGGTAKQKAERLMLLKQKGKDAPRSIFAPVPAGGAQKGEENKKKT